MFEELQTATKSLREIVQDLEPACLEGDDAVWLTEAVARSLLDDAKVSLLVRNGAELDGVGRPRRTIPAHLRRQLETRYPACGVEGCANERFLEIDHIIPVAAGGRSTPENTWRICGHHHDLKTYFGWRVTGPTYD